MGGWCESVSNLFYGGMIVPVAPVAYQAILELDIG